MPGTIQHLFLDLDGVFADFTRAALRLHDEEHYLESWPTGERDISKVLGISKTAFWKKIDRAGTEFWESLEPYPWFEELIDVARNTAPFALLTAPSLSPDSLAGKAAWIDRHFPKIEGRKFRNFLITSQKHLLAGPGRVLIDDSASMVSAFRRAGGNAILFPQIWNDNHAIENKIDFVRAELSTLAQSIS
ncbi:MAG: hypothetical protein AAGH89_17220 [Verrucomicrobiota bacterium]